MAEGKWRWRYSGWTGFWYGPIPAGLFIVGGGFVWVYFAYYHGTF